MPELTDLSISSLPLWNHFIDKTATETSNREMVIKHLDGAFPLLERVIVAFPTYTLHNKQHQYNVIKIMGELLGPRLHDLSALETAMLILSAVYHDIGMVFKPEELKQVAQESEFVNFLKANTSAKLQFEEHGKVATEDLVGWYCRWMHAKRVWIFLEQADAKTALAWNGIPIKTQIGNLCESHNESVAYIKNNESFFDKNFLGDCDLTFCALLLRLADIMDFDDTRTPLSVYEYLELNKSSKSSVQISKEEWNKHLNSKGFTVERSGNKVNLRFIAVPEHPRIEIGIRNFLKLIDSELNACSGLLRFCSEKWQHFNLPDEINVDGIISKNYKSGNYHFSLAEDDVLKLLTGEGIYNDDFIFLRELLQNAIDTSRHREFKERLSNKNFIADPITVSFFTDIEGYQWIRIDDFGMGMNQEIIENHLLKKGKSYYKSDAFKLEKLLIRQNINADFVPISRFGIGLLSCFIAGDKIEINTLHKDEPGNAFRLSVEGQNGFFVMQSKKIHHTPSPMPAENQMETGFRSKPGTSIAVRVTTNREYEGFSMKRQLERYLMAPPIPVSYEGQFIGGGFDEMLLKPWAEQKSYPMPTNFEDRVKALTGLPFEEGIKVTFLPISLTEDALSANLKGQLLMLYIDLPNETLKDRPDLRFGLSLEGKKLTISCTKSKEDSGNKSEDKESEDISSIMDDVRVPEAITTMPYYPYDHFHFGGLRLSHNGIRIAETKEAFWLSDHQINNYRPFGSSYNNSTYICSGIIYYQDELLPELTVSRNEIRVVTFPVIANTLTAMRKLNSRILYDPELHKFDFFKQLDRDVDYAANNIERSKFYENNRDFWDNEIVLHTSDGDKTISEILKGETRKIAFYHSHHSSEFFRNLLDYILESNFDISISFSKDGYHVKSTYHLIKRSATKLNGIGGFEPLTFRRYDNYSSALTPDRGVNIDHPYVQWFMLAYPVLQSDYTYYAKQLIYGLFGSFDSSKPEIKKINRILDKLRQVLPQELRPPKEINPTDKDFEDAAQFFKE